MERERITISIKKKVLDKVDSTIDGTNIRNRSHAIETLALKSLGSIETSQAVILLGGDNALKAVPAAKEYLPRLKEAGFNNIMIGVGFLADKVKDKIGFGIDYDLSIQYNDKGQGSGGTLNILKKSLRSTFIVINTGKDIEVDLKKLIDFHKKHCALVTIATTDLESFEGIYVVEPEALSRLPRGFSMIEDDLFPSLIKDQELIVYPISN